MFPVDFSLGLQRVLLRSLPLAVLREEDRRLRPLRTESLDEAVEVEALSCVADLDAEERPRDPLGGADQPRVYRVTILVCNKLLLT